MTLDPERLGQSFEDLSESWSTGEAGFFELLAANYGPVTVDLVGRREIAERAGASLATVDAWRRRHPDFPAPEWHVSGTPIWRWETVAAWIAKPRPSGRPRVG